MLTSGTRIMTLSTVKNVHPVLFVLIFSRFIIDFAQLHCLRVRHFIRTRATRPDVQPTSFSSACAFCDGLFEKAMSFDTYMFGWSDKIQITYIPLCIWETFFRPMRISLQFIF